MPEIKCPKCGEVFTVDDGSYQEMLSKIKNEEFQKELEKEREIVKAKAEKENAELKAKKDEEINSLKSKLNDLVGKAQLAEAQKQIEINAALEAERAKVRELQAQLSGEKTRQDLAIANAVATQKEELATKNATIITLTEAAKTVKANNELAIQSIKEEYEQKLKQKQDEVDYFKDLKAKMSTKMIGETLEQHCELTFEQVRATGFQYAEFGKDNDASSGSKGDYIFRDKTEDGIEYISIMFEMKNEADETKTKHKNEDFFKELDKDRKEKNCEYAVLVSLLESENDYYNQGIVDVSYKTGYEKMYVIRPQFFLPFITMVRNAALKNVADKRALVIAQNQNLDITNFEESLASFKDAFTKNVEDAGKQFANALEEIDKTINHLTKVRESLVKTGNHLSAANKKVDQISVKKLTKGNPTMKARFEEIAKAKENVVDNDEE